MKSFIAYLEDKMDTINPQQLLQGQPEKWVQTVSRLPLPLQQELLTERPQPTPEDIQWVNSWQVGNQPVAINIKDLLKIPDNLSTIARCPADIVQEINQKWGLQVQPGQVYDQTPNRYKDVAKKFTGNTAKPSVMINGEIVFGCGRFISALLRGDQQMMVWEIKTK
jgi:hypothetical protein